MGGVGIPKIPPPQDAALAHPAAVLTKIGVFPRETEAGGGESKGKTGRKWGFGPLPCRCKKPEIKLERGGETKSGRFYGGRNVN